jgi:hypothetical protein
MSFLFPAVLAAALLYLVFFWVRKMRWMGTAMTWPPTMGRIEGLNLVNQGHDLPVYVADVGYSYEVNGTFYSGEVRIPGAWWQSSPSRQLVGVAIQVRVNPKDPSESALISRSIPGLDQTASPALLRTGSNR